MKGSALDGRDPMHDRAPVLASYISSYRTRRLLKVVASTAAAVLVAHLALLRAYLPDVILASTAMCLSIRWHLRLRALSGPSRSGNKVKRGPSSRFGRLEMRHCIVHTCPKKSRDWDRIYMLSMCAPYEAYCTSSGSGETRGGGSMVIALFIRSEGDGSNLIRRRVHGFEYSNSRCQRHVGFR
jgi:hypothetical protein